MRPYGPYFHPCLRRERDYDEGRIYRIQDFETELASGALVSIMLRIDKRRRARAVNVLGRIWNVETTQKGSYVVRFNLHDLHNKPRFEMRETFSRGLVEGPIDDDLLTAALGAPVTEAYLQPYQPEHRERELQAIIAPAKH